MAETFARLEFEEYPDDWVRVRVSPVSLSTFTAIVDKLNESVRRFMPEPLDELCKLLAPVIDSWSFAEPVNLKGLRARDVNLVFAIGREWVTGVRSVPLPLPKRSSDGDTEDQSPPSSP